MRDVVTLFGGKGRLLLDDAALSSGLPMFELIVDWYCLRQGAGLALSHIARERFSLYRVTAKRFGREADRHDGSVESFLEIVFGALGLFLGRAEGNARSGVPARAEA